MHCSPVLFVTFLRGLCRPLLSELGVCPPQCPLPKLQHTHSLKKGRKNVYFILIMTWFLRYMFSFWPGFWSGQMLLELEEGIMEKLGQIIFQEQETFKRFCQKLSDCHLFVWRLKGPIVSFIHSIFATSSKMHELRAFLLILSRFGLIPNKIVIRSMHYFAYLILKWKFNIQHPNSLLK